MKLSHLLLYSVVSASLDRLQEFAAEKDKPENGIVRQCHIYLFVFLTDFTSDHCKCLHITLRGEGTQCSCVVLSVNVAVEWSSVLSVECECHSRME